MESLPLFKNIKQNIADIFSRKNLVWHILACLITYVMVVSTLDWEYFKFVQSSPIKKFLSPAVIIGGLLPTIGILALYTVSKIRRSMTMLNVTWALAQAEVLSWVISSTYKAFTGRVQPDMLSTLVLNTSTDWQFGFMRHGIFWGWPSSHTTVAFAMAASLIALYPKNKYILCLGSLYALYIGFGISMSIHWFSEFIAGAIIGAVVGTVVGKSFRLK